EQYADDVLIRLTSYSESLTHFTSNINDTALTQPTSFVAPNADDTFI
ncbi:1391_t:CDS:1, partial [Rhizophagus irregularis]